MPDYRGITFDDGVIDVVRHMRDVEDYREALGRLQASWDTLSLLGQLSGSAAEISGTRASFERLTVSLLDNLAIELKRKAVSELRAKARNAIDVLVRNLFERTADIGFLAADVVVARALDGQGAEALPARFRAYVAKYSVYGEAMLFDASGALVARLGAGPEPVGPPPFHALAMAKPADYVEHHGSWAPLGPGDHLVYARAVVDTAGHARGVLALVFRLADEMQGIFQHLVGPDDWSTIALVDARGRIMASSCAIQLPVGQRLPASAIASAGEVVRHGGREYLAVGVEAASFQGYAGPGWRAVGLLPVDVAFDAVAAEALDGVPDTVLGAVMRQPRLFSETLRAIPEQAARIQGDLNRSVWNGSVRQSLARDDARGAPSATFAKTLLWEISNAGRKTQGVFDRSIGNLRRTIVAAVMQDARARAAFAIDVMDRNLYERANDCRWWALDPRLAAALERPGADTRAEAAQVLSGINDLYTVYDSLCLFDAAGRVVAVSRPHVATSVGEVFAGAAPKRALALGAGDRYAVSDFEPHPMYGERHTYVYAAPIRSGGRAIGGVAIVFDAAPQFAAILEDAMPRDASNEPLPGAFALFVDRGGRVVASSDGRFPVGSIAPVAAVDGVAMLDAEAYAVGAAACEGYREFRTSDGYSDAVTGICAIPLGTVSADQGTARTPIELQPIDTHGEETTEIATFHVARHWLGVPATMVAAAVDASGLTPTPIGQGLLAGFKTFEGVPIPVLDLDRRVGRGGEVPPGERAIVVVRARGTRVGLLVDALGPIPDVRPGAIQRLDRIGASDDLPIMGLVGGLAEGDGASAMLTIIDIEALLAGTRERGSTGLIAAE